MSYPRWQSKATRCPIGFRAYGSDYMSQRRSNSTPSFAGLGVAATLPGPQPSLSADPQSDLEAASAQLDPLLCSLAEAKDNLNEKTYALTTNNKNWWGSEQIAETTDQLNKQRLVLSVKWRVLMLVPTGDLDLSWERLAQRTLSAVFTIWTNNTSSCLVTSLSSAAWASGWVRRTFGRWWRQPRRCLQSQAAEAAMTPLMR